MPHFITVFITYDNPECGGIVDAFISDLERNMSELKREVRVTVEEIAIEQNNLHHSLLADHIKDIKECILENVYVFSLLKGDSPEEYLKIRELCATGRSVPLKVEILTHLCNYKDAGLIVRNLVRIVTHRVYQLCSSE